MNNRTVFIANMVLRALFLIQLILGLLFWFGKADQFIGLHLFLGLLFVVDVWFLGVAQGLRANGSLGLTVGTFVVGLVLAIVGIIQAAGILPLWLQILHLLLALGAMGLGEASAARYSRSATSAGS